MAQVPADLVQAPVDLVRAPVDLAQVQEDPQAIEIPAQVIATLRAEVMLQQAMSADLSMRDTRVKAMGATLTQDQDIPSSSGVMKVCHFRLL